MEQRQNQGAGKREVVVVTGASAGVGRATVREFAKRGAWIGLLARGEDGLEGARKDIEQLGGEALVVPTDVADPAQVEAAAEAIETHFGPIDIWVNNAMTSVFSPFVDMTADEFKRVTDVCYLGFVYGTMCALRRMRPRNKGTIIQVGSALAYRGIPLQSAYCGAKHAIQGFTESVRTELMHENSNIHITMVQLPAMNTPQFTWVKSRLPNKPQPVPPIFDPELAARAIVWSADHRRRELFVTGTTLKAIVGNKLFPSYADRVLADSGYKSQQTDTPVSPTRRHNLWEPVPGDHGAHGPFDERSKSTSLQLWATMNRGRLLLASLVGLITSVFFAKQASDNRP